MITEHMISLLTSLIGVGISYEWNKDAPVLAPLSGFYVYFICCCMTVLLTTQVGDSDVSVVCWDLGQVQV